MSESTPLLLLDNATLTAVAQRADVQREFPFVKQLTKSLTTTGRRCGGCSGRRKVNALEALKQHIGRMPADQKERLKKILGAEKIRILYKNVNNQPVRATF